ncbi:U6 snRNA-associated Sm-like protein LSm1 [Marchantia polymorpha subsp. ruderalis]|uniref:U6 snRNA-associated Sm-like protein LSm1 n=2 Tax=Marchantia polymorpha TaxID=3197 RepID=A0AAF6BQZ6_MARPO|nr:hypothetical protein MARPO_0016s0204 [Marchantia polymorpha]BBN14430.1 hypothetical protein Mp_6g11650 [Marchantia polymorpha subsp. ruderalis]|eukprot:PTQ45164.1 hypothetical protein MARPO_0016s0204 [Marchantia polymorpha]
MTWIVAAPLLYIGPAPSFTSYLDKKVILLLRDAKVVVGVLTAFDEFGNVVLQHVFERIIVNSLYCDRPLGLFVGRGENVIFCGELGQDGPEMPAHMVLVTEDEIRSAQRAEKISSHLRWTMRKRMEFLDSDVG